jgi:hypothetical protein
MDATRFDQIAKRFAARRLSRRQALRQGGTGLTAGALAAAGLGRPAAAQDATPPAAAAGDKVSYLFLQAFRAGSIVPKAGAAGTFTLTLEQGLGQTVYFSDRPERLVGAAPTPRFLDGLGFTPANPPNAALVVEATPGETAIAVVELFNPAYDAATHTATYDAKVLADYEATLEVGFTEAPTDLAALAPRFGAAHLFIDDCPDVSGCLRQEVGGPAIIGPIPSGINPGQCWDGGCICCQPCNGWSQDDFDNACNDAYPECENNCVVDLGY